MPDVKMPSVKLPKVKAPHVQVSLPKAEVSLPKGQAEVQEGEVALQGPDAEGGLEVAAGKVEGGGMKIHMPKVKVPSVAFSKPTVKAPKVEADVSLPKVDASLPEAELKAGDADISIAAPDGKLPSVEGSLELQAPDVDLKVPSGEGSLEGAELEATGLKGKLKLPKFDKPKFGVSPPKVEGLEGEVSLPSADVDLPSATVTAAADVPGAKAEGAGWKVEKPSLKMPKADIKAPKVDISLPSVDVTLPKASVDLQAPEASLTLEGEAKAPEKEATKTKDGKFKMPKFGMPSFGWSSSREAKATVAADADVSLKEPHLTVPSGTAEVDVTLPAADIQPPSFEVVIDSSSGKGDDLVKTKSSIFRIPKVSLSKNSKGEMLSPSAVDVSVSENVCGSVAEESPAVVSGSIESTYLLDNKGDSASKNTKFRIPSLGFSKVDISSSKIEQESPLPKGDITLTKYKINVAECESTVSSLADENLSVTDFEFVNEEGSLEQGTLKPGIKIPASEISLHDTEITVKIPKFRKPKFGISWSKGKPSGTDVGSKVESEISKGSITSDMTDANIEKTTSSLHAELGVNIHKPESVLDAPKLDVSLPSTEVTMPKLEVDFHGPAIECKAEQEVVSGEKDNEEKGNKFKTSKFKLPSFSWSPKKEAVAPSEDEGHREELTSDIQIIEGSLEVKSPDTSVERTPSEIAVGDVETKIEGSEGKIKMPKFHIPKLGITHSKGKVSEKDVSKSKSEVQVPQLKATVEIADIAVEALNLEVACGAGTETYSPKIKMTKDDNKASEADLHLPSTDISVPKPDSDIQDLDAALKIKGEIKQDGEGEEKEGHFKMPKFKLPSFSRSPKKEASVKPDSGANLEDPKLATVSGSIDTEVRGTATDDQGTGPALDMEISAGKGEQKSPIKKPQFVMPKISLSKIKVPKSQTHPPKVEADASVPKTEREGDDSIQIPDIEISYSKRTEEGAQISIKPADVKIPTVDFSKKETGAFQTEMGISSAKIEAALPSSEGSFQQVVLKSSSTNEDTIQKTGIKLHKGEASIELGSPEIATEISSVVDERKMKLEGPEGKIKMPKFQKPKFGISLTKEKGPETEIRSPKTEAEPPQLKMTNEIADIAVGVPASELTSYMSDPGLGVCKTKTPQVPTAVIEDPKGEISPKSLSKSMTEGAIESLEDKKIKLKEHEIKAEEVQTEEHQGWFKMPKFRIPTFGRTSLKEKKGDADIEKSMEKAQAGIPSAEVQTETSIPENTFSLPHALAEITIGKQGIPKLGDTVKSSDVSLPKVEGDIPLSAEGTDSKVNIPKTETYADIVKHGAEGQTTHTSEFTVSSAESSKSHVSASEITDDNSLTNRFPTCTLTLQEEKVKSQDMKVPKVESSTKLETSGVGCKPSAAEITLKATQEKIDVSLPKEVLDIQNQEAVIKTGKIQGEMKTVGKDSEGNELKRPTYEWSTTKGSEEGAYVTAKLEDLKVEVPTLKMDVKIARVDPEMKFQVKSVEKDMSAGVEVQVEDGAETSKIKIHKFKIPKFGVLHPEVKDFENYINLPKSGADSVSKTEPGTAEMRFQKSEGSVGLKSPALDNVELSDRITVETVDKSQGGPEVNIKFPKLKIPRFTFKALPTEADVSVSTVVTDPKGSSADIEVVQLQASSAVPEGAPEALEGGIQKAKSKILTLTEPDIKTAQMTTTIESSLSNARQDVHWSYIDGQEVSEKVEPEHVAIERCEIYTTEILKESEILSSEVKTATLGFSLLKVKLPESHSNLEVLVQKPLSTEDDSVSKPKGANESFGVAAQRIGSAELKLSDKLHGGPEESSGEINLPELKPLAVEVKPSSKLEESCPDKSPEGITAGPLSKDVDVAEGLEDEEKDIANEKEKTDSKRSPGRFKFWVPSIGFSSSGDETSTDAKIEIKKTVPEDVKSADTSDNDSSKQTEKTGWFRFPKLGFTSPSKKAKTVAKEEVGHKEGRISDEDSPSDKPDVFFDAQESLSPKETTEGENVATDGASPSVPVSRTIVTSSARTELILLEEGKDSQSNTPGDKTK